MSRTLSTNIGSLDSLKVSRRCGCSPKARQMRPTLEVEMPLCRAMLRTPMRGIRWLTLQRLHDDALDFAVVDLARDARSRLVEQPAEPVLDKTLAPFAHGLRCHLLARRHRLVAQTRRAAQHDPRPQRQSLRRLAPLRVAFQNPGNLGRQLNPRHRAARPHLLAPAATAPRQFITRISDARSRVQAPRHPDPDGGYRSAHRSRP